MSGGRRRLSTMKLNIGAVDDDLSGVFMALGDPTRRALVARLCDGDATVGELAEPFVMSLQAVSKHIKVLEDAGPVTKTTHGQQRTIHLEAGVFHLMTKWIERYRRQAEQHYQKLDAVLAEMAGSGTATRSATNQTNRKKSAS